MAAGSVHRLSLPLLLPVSSLLLSLLLTGSHALSEYETVYKHLSSRLDSFLYKLLPFKF